MADETNVVVNDKVETTSVGGYDDETVVYKERKRVMFLGLPWTFTKYIITPSLLTVATGFFKTVEDDCYMYKIQDVKFSATLLEKMLRLGTITLYTGDVTHPEIKLEHIKKAKEIKGYLLKASEEARIKRRTLNTQDISVHAVDLDGDGIPDLRA